MLKSMCSRCAVLPSSETSAPQQCGFVDGVFSVNNWNCALFNAIRDLVSEDQPAMPPGVHHQNCQGQKYATVDISNVHVAEDCFGLTLWVTWYKNRGRTEQMWILNDFGTPRRPTEQELLAILAFYERSV